MAIYENDGYEYDLSPSVINRNKALLESMYAPEEEPKPARKRSYTTADAFMDMHVRNNQNFNKYISFSEGVRTYLVTEALYKVYSEAMYGVIPQNPTNASIMRSIVNKYVADNGYDNILTRMKTGSVMLSEMYNIITEHTKKILENVEENDPATFEVPAGAKDDFAEAINKAVDPEDPECVTNAIRDKVVDDITDFVNANTREHDDIQAALQDAQEKIADAGDDEELKECYEFNAKRKVNDIRNSPKSVFYSMVYAMSESVMKHPEIQYEFMDENSHLDMRKIVSRVSMLYGFMETINTARIENVDKAFIEQTIAGLAE